MKAARKARTAVQILERLSRRRPRPSADPKLTKAMEHEVLIREFGTLMMEQRQQLGLTVDQVATRIARVLTSEEEAKILLRLRCFGVVLKCERQNAGLSIMQLASKADVNAEKIAAWEKGERLDEIAFTDMYDLSKALNVGFLGLWVESDRVAKLEQRA